MGAFLFDTSSTRRPGGGCALSALSSLLTLSFYIISVNFNVSSSLFNMSVSLSDRRFHLGLGLLRTPPLTQWRCRHQIALIKHEIPDCSPYSCMEHIRVSWLRFQPHWPRDGCFSLCAASGRSFLYWFISLLNVYVPHWRIQGEAASCKFSRARYCHDSVISIIVTWVLRETLSSCIAIKNLACQHTCRLCFVMTNYNSTARSQRPTLYITIYL